MRKYLLPKQGKFYKANLHLHTNVSDGGSEPETFKKVYMSKGYSILAYSDHERLVSHKELTDENFLALTAVELGIHDLNCPHNYPLVCHLGCIALDENIDTQLLYHREKYIAAPGWPREKLKVDESKPDFERVYSIDGINAMIEGAVKENFFVVYNHPAWSQESYPQYSNYNGMHAMEIINALSNVKTGISEYNDRVYDDMLRLGKRIYCIAADDSHTTQEARARGCAGAWTMIKAEKLDYPTIAKALKDGNFYSSEGPEIKELYYENGAIHVETSPADKILFTTWPARGKAFLREWGGELITSAEYVPHEVSEYVRITVIDEYGKKAYSNAYFLDELKK